MDRAKEIVDLIIKSSTETEAVKTLSKTLELLYLSSNYTDLVKLKNRLEEFKERFKKVSEEYKHCDKSYSNLDYYKMEFNFLYRDINDELTFDIDRLKIFYEEKKTVQRFDSMSKLQEDDEVQGKFKAKSASALRDIVGGDPSYREFTALISMSYGMWSELRRLLESVKLFSDTIASQIRAELLIINKDQK